MGTAARGRKKNSKTVVLDENRQQISAQETRRFLQQQKSNAILKLNLLQLLVFTRTTYLSYSIQPMLTKNI